jgi:hypothetical protein
MINNISKDIVNKTFKTYYSFNSENPIERMKHTFEITEEVVSSAETLKLYSNNGKVFTQLNQGELFNTLI